MQLSVQSQVAQHAHTQCHVAWLLTGPVSAPFSPFFEPQRHLSAATAERAELSARLAAGQLEAAGSVDGLLSSAPSAPNGGSSSFVGGAGGNAEHLSRELSASRGVVSRLQVCEVWARCCGSGMWEVALSTSI